MTLTVNLKKGLHQKRWEPCAVVPFQKSAGVQFAAAVDKIFLLSSTSVPSYVYTLAEGSWAAIPTVTGISGSFGTGTTSRWHAHGPSGTASAGTTTTITTGLTIVRDLRGSKIRITGGPNAGLDLTIVSNTTGANAVITVAAQSNAFSGSTTFVLLTGRLWCVVGGASPGFGYYDWAFNTWTSRSVTGLTAGSSNTGNLIGTTGIESGALITGTATAGAATTLTDSGKAWVTNALAAFQVRITGGTGAGQVRKITSNTDTVLTVSTWTTNPDNTSTYTIEPDEDSFYFIGNLAVTMYKYSISGNSWSTVNPSVARSNSPGNGCTGSIPVTVTDSAWTDVTQPQNGRYIYSFRGNSFTDLARYDIAANSWSAITYGGQADTFNTGTCAVVQNERILIVIGGTNRCIYFDVVKNEMMPLSTLGYPGAGGSDGCRLALMTYTEGGVSIPFLYLLRDGGTEMFRQMLF